MTRRLLTLLVPLLLTGQMWPFPGPGRAPSAAGPDFVTVGSLGTNAIPNPGTALNIQVSAQLDAGNVGVCAFGKDENGTGTTDGSGNAEFTSMTDDVGNTWVEAGEWCNMQTSTLRDGACTSIYYTKAAANLAALGYVSLTIPSMATGRIAGTCWEFTTTKTSLSLAAGSNGVANDGADPGALSDATGVAKWHLFMRSSACETTAAAGYTVSSGYVKIDDATADSGTAATSMGVRGEFRIANESTSATSDPTWTAADCASLIVGIDGS